MPFRNDLLPYVFLLFFALSSAAFAQSNTGAPQSKLEMAYLEPKISGTLSYTHRQLNILLIPDKKLCEKNYGKNWERACRQATELSGRPAPGVTISPAIEGKWIFTGDHTLTFTPKDYWRPGQTYSIKLNNDLFGKRITVTNTALTAKADLPAAKVGSFQFLYDPDVKSNVMALNGKINFNYPMDQASVLSRLRIVAFDESMQDQLDLDALELVWNTDKTAVNVSARVRSLPQTNMIAMLVIEPGAVTARDNIPLSNDKTLAKVIIPGRKGFLQVTGLALFNEINDNLDNELILAVDFNANVPQEELLKHLAVLLLPKTNTAESTKDFPWDRFSPTEEDLAKSTPIALEPIQSTAEKRDSQSHRFRIKGDPERYIWINIDEKLSPNGKYTMSGPSRAALKIPSEKQHIEFMQPGTILSMGGDKKLSIYARGLDSIHWQAERVKPAYLNLLFSAGNPYWGEEEPSFQDPYPYVGYESISDILQGDIPLAHDNPGKAQFASIDLSDLYSRNEKGIFKLTLTGMTDDKQQVEADRFILLTDLAMIVKKNADGTRDVFVVYISSGKPVRWADVDVIGKNGVSLLSRETDGDGHIRLPSLDGFSKEKTPVVLTARKGRDLSVIPINDSSLITDYSRFQIAGQRSSASDLNAFVFSQRGIYRPGDTLLFGAIIKHGDWDLSAAGLPLKALLYDPVGRKIMQKEVQPDSTGLLEVSQQIPESAVTGKYRLDIQLAADADTIIGSSTVRVEEFQPDTLKISLSFSQKQSSKQGWIIPKDLKAIVELQNLYGTPAANHLIAAQLTLSRSSFRFPRYAEYNFYDPTNTASNPIQAELEDETTDEQGRAVFDLPMDNFRDGTYVLSFTAEGFAAGSGRSVLTERSILVSPLQHVLGYRTTANLNYISKNNKASVEFLAVDPDLEPVALKDLTLRITEQEYTVSLIKDSSGAYRYDYVVNEKEIHTEKISCPASGFKYDLPTATPGYYKLSILDAKGTLLNYFDFAIAGNNPKSFDSTMDSILRLRLDKDEYAAGDTINLYLTTPYDGFGLVTIERDRVFAWEWITAKAGDSVHSIELPEDFQGRGYVNVSFVRSLESREIFLNPHAYAVAPFTANVAKRDLGIALKVPEKIKPGENLNIAYRAKDKGQVIVYAVDEGILQLTNYKTPSPIDFFLRDRALEVDNIQVFDLIMPEFSMLRKILPAFGGDLLRGGLDPRHNPFKRKNEPPVQYWSGIVQVSQKEAVLSMAVPQYFNGRLRVMAVGASEKQVASTDAYVLVQGDLIVTPQMPLTVSPGDEFEVTALIANNLEGSGAAFEIAVKVESDPGLKLVSSPPSSIKVDEGKEGMIAFRVKAEDVLGDNAIKIIVQARGKNGMVEADRDMSLSIRPASPRISAVLGGYSAKAETSIPIDRNMYPYEAIVEASASAIPMAAVQGLAKYLETYPYGCTEQLISKAFPQLILLTHPELMPVKPGETIAQRKKDAEILISAAIQSIQSRMTYHGLNMWPDLSQSYVDPLLTAYAGDFLLEARQAGFNVPDYLITDVLKTLNNQVVDGTAGNLSEARAKAYALWVLTRSGQVTSQDISSLVSTLNKDGADWKKDVTASLLAACYKMMKQEQQADDLIAGYQVTPKNLWADTHLFDSLAAQSLHLTILAKSFPGRLNNPAIRDLVMTTVGFIQSQDYSSFSAAQAVRAIGAYSLAQKPDNIDLSMLSVNRQGQTTALVPNGDLVKTASAVYDTREIKFKTNGEHGLFWQVFTEGFDMNPPVAAISNGMEISRQYLIDGKPIEESSVAQGDEITVLIKAHAYGRSISNVAITDLLPGGFEMVLNKEPGDDAPSSSASLGSKMNIAYTDRREDRMIIFVDLSTSERVFAYTIKAVNKGDFVVPPVYAEAMYDRSLRANSAASRITVK